MQSCGSFVALLACCCAKMSSCFCLQFLQIAQYAVADQCDSKVNQASAGMASLLCWKLLLLCCSRVRCCAEAFHLLCLIADVGHIRQLLAAPQMAAAVAPAKLQ